MVLAAKRRSGLTNTGFDFPSVTPPTQFEKDLYAYLMIITVRCLPAHNVWNPEFRDFWRCHCHFGVHYFKVILFMSTNLWSKKLHVTCKDPRALSSMTAGQRTVCTTSASLYKLSGR